MPSSIDATRARALFDQGLSCNAIARELGVHASTVSRWAKREQLTFARAAATAAASTARQADLRELAAQVARGMAAVAVQELSRAQKPYTVYAFGGGEFFTFSSHELDLPPAEAVRSMQTTAAIAHDKLLKQIEQESSGGPEAELSLLDRLEQQLEAEFGTVDDGEFAEPA